MNWNGRNTADWPTFSNLRCRTTAHSSTAATVSCTFHELHAMASDAPDSFWTVELHDGGHAGWLIASFGTG